jgi:hypothetical protein
MTSCSRRSGAEHAGDRFIEAYYVQVDQMLALEHATGLARERLQTELQQVTQLRRDGQFAQARPKVAYTHIRTQPEGRQVLLIYDLTITPQQASPILKRVMLITEPVGEQWKVINFTETDTHP